jgi:hypothetical protein
MGNEQIRGCSDKVWFGIGGLSRYERGCVHADDRDSRKEIWHEHETPSVHALLWSTVWHLAGVLYAVLTVLRVTCRCSECM